jgi:DNA modification methylase
MGSYEVFEGDAGRVLSHLPGKFCQTCITFPAYWMQRDYRHRDQLGRERTPEQYVGRLVDVLMEVYRILREDRTLWVNLDDTYRRKQLAGIPWRLAVELQRRDWLPASRIVLVVCPDSTGWHHKAWVGSMQRPI